MLPVVTVPGSYDPSRGFTPDAAITSSSSSGLIWVGLAVLVGWILFAGK